MTPVEQHSRRHGMTREEFVAAVAQSTQACVWFNFGASEHRTSHMTMIPVSKGELLRLFGEMPELLYIRAEIVGDRLLCIGWDGAGTPVPAVS